MRKQLRQMLAILAVVTMLLSVYPFGMVVTAAEETTAPANLALGKSVQVSSVWPNSGNDGEKAVDGKPDTRWGAKKGDNAGWIVVDLEKETALGRVAVSWETSYSKKYEMYVSNDKAAWGEPVATVTYGGENKADELIGGKGEVHPVETYLPKGVAGRYLKIQSLDAATQYGVSIWELEVYAPDAHHPDIPMGYAGVAIDSLKKLEKMRDTITSTANVSANKCYFLTDDITVSSEWKPIGKDNGNYSFAGVFDGNGHTITFDDVTITSYNDWNSAFFYSMKDNAIIRNLVTAGSVTSANQSAAVLVGEILNGTIENCVNEASLDNTRDTGTGGFVGRAQQGTLKNLTNKGTIGAESNRQNVGGIVGRVTASGVTIEGCTNTGTVKGTHAVGGVIGLVEDNVHITNCTNNGAVNGYQKVGGIVGDASAWFTIRNSTNLAAVTTTGHYAGGLVGRMAEGVIVNSVNFGAVTCSTNWAGGLVGTFNSNNAITEEQAKAGLVQILIANSANCGDVKSSWLAGGISAGLANSTSDIDQQTNAYSFRIENCYNAGKVNATSGNGGDYRRNNVDPIVARQSIQGVVTSSVNCYGLQDSAVYVDSSVTVYDTDTMQSPTFVDTLNENAASGIAYKKAVDEDTITAETDKWMLEPGGFPVFSDTAMPQRKIRVACVGDSITYGVGASNATNNYVSRLQALLGDGYDVKNYGNSGKTATSKVNDSYDKTNEFINSQAFYPDVVTIMLGTNDSKSAIWNVGTYEQDLRTLVETYRHLLSNPRIILATAPTVYNGAGINTWDISDTIIYNQVAPIQRRVAAEMGCVLVDTNKHTRHWLDALTTYFPTNNGAVSDGVHPADAGHLDLANLFYAGIQEALSPAQILSFTWNNYIADIDYGNHRIHLTVPYGTNLAALTPTVTVSEGAILSPAGAQDFTRPVTYTLTAADGSIRTYTVTVEETMAPDIPEGYTGVAISSVADLKLVSASSTTAKVYYYLTTDLVIEDETWTPIGTNETNNAFHGIFDGRGHTITYAGPDGNGIGFTGSWNGGLFFAITGDAVIKNVTIAGKIKSSSATSNGALVGQVMRGRLDSCINRATIDLKGSRYTGGLAGRLYEGVIVNCLNYGDVMAHEYTGGLVGQTSWGSSNTETPLTEEEETAGVIKALIANSANFGNVTTSYKGGGILGHTYDKEDFYHSYRIVNCYNTGTISGTGVGSIMNDERDVSAYDVDRWYTLENTCAGSKNRLGEQMSKTALQSETFVNTLNTAVQAGIAYKTSLNGEAITVPLTRWRYIEGGYPVLSTGIIVKATGKYGESLFTAQISSAEELAKVMGNAKVPALGGYLFAGWNEPVDASTYEMIYDTPSQILAVTPVYERDEAAKDYTITIVNAAAVDGQQTVVVSGTKLSFDTRVDLTGAIDGETPAYWEVNGAKVSFHANVCTLYIGGNTEVKAVYDSAEDLKPDVVLQHATYSTDGEKYNLSVIAQTSIPDGYTVKSYGVYYTGTENAIQSLPNGGAAIRVVSSKKGANQQYMTHLLSVGSGKTRFARAYVELSDGQILYSNTYVKFTTPIAGESTVVTMHMLDASTAQ